MSQLPFLPALWVALIGAAWALHLALGGAETGATMLAHRLRGAPGEPDPVARVIGPTWQANDVWLIVAVASTLGAFPGWYAAWAQGLYGPLVVALVALIVRHAGVELAAHAGPAGRRAWTLGVVASSWALPVVWGVAWASALDGSLGRGGLDVLSAPTLACGVALALVWRATGAGYLAARGDGALRVGAVRVLRVSAPLAAVAGLLASGVVADAAVVSTPTGAWVALVLGAAALVVLGIGGRRGRARVALWAGGLAVVAGMAATVLALAPLGIAGPDGIGLAREASGDTTLGLMAAVAVVVGPALVAAQLYAYGRFDRAGRRPRRQPVVQRAFEALR